MAVIAACTLTACSPAATTPADFAHVIARPEARIAVPDVDEVIASNLDAAFTRNRLHVKYAIDDRTVTLTGVVNSQTKRARAEHLAAAVINVRSVVNDLRVKPRQLRLSDK